jgi:MSHA biogenesis protein MshK
MATPASSSVKTRQKTKYVLSSILFSGQRRHAIINNKLVRQGEMVEGARLVRLTTNSARLRIKGKIIELTILDKKTKNSFKVSRKSLNEKNI